MSVGCPIHDEIHTWVRTVLSVPCDAYGGLPPCPFAAKAWERDLVSVSVVSSVDDALSAAALFDADDHRVLVCAVLGSGGLTVEDFNASLDAFNALRSGAWVMGSHHDAPENDLMPEFESKTDVEYGLILVQSLKYLVDASLSLRKTRYYDRFTADDMAYIVRRSEEVECVE